MNNPVQSPLMPRGGKRNGSGRPIKYGDKTVSKSFRLPESLDKRIQKKADKEKVSWSELVIKSLKKMFK